MLTLRPMSLDDLATVALWLDAPHVARWWKGDSVEEYRRCIEGAEPTEMLIAVLDGRPVGFAQSYLWSDYPDAGSALGTAPGEVGIDYALGEADVLGRGLGTELVAALVRRVRTRYPGAGIVSDPDATNQPSRRVLERNGFGLVSERPVRTERTTAPMAIYRSPSPGAPLVRMAGDADVGVLAALRAEWVAEWDCQRAATSGDPDYPERFAEWFAAERGRRLTWLAESGGVVGMLNLVVFRRMPKPGRSSTEWGYVSNVYVSPPARRLGLGTALLEEALRYCRARQYARVVLSPSEQARAMYARAGFSPATELMVLALE